MEKIGKIYGISKDYRKKFSLLVESLDLEKFCSEFDLEKKGNEKY